MFPSLCFLFLVRIFLVSLLWFWLLLCMRARRRFLFSLFFFTSSCQFLILAYRSCFSDGCSLLLWFICLLGQIQIWVGSVAFALRSDHSVFYVHVVVLWWCISVPNDLYLSRFGDLGGIRATIAIINRAHGGMNFSNSGLHILQVISGIYRIELPGIPLFFLRLAPLSTFLSQNIYP